jgi:hypothetical protein
MLPGTAYVRGQLKKLGGPVEGGSGLSAQSLRAVALDQPESNINDLLSKAHPFNSLD